jgi:hypothetical protein
MRQGAGHHGALSLRVDFVERRLHARSNILRRALSPEVHEEKARLFGEHVAVQRRHQNMVRLKFGYHWIYFFSGENEVAGGATLPEFAD